jgi:gliding motility-associated-like protein
MIRYYILFLFTTILLKVNSQDLKKRCGIDYPENICISEEINGDLVLNWREPEDESGVFLKYELFSLESPFSPIKTFNLISTTTEKVPNQFINNNFFLVTTILCNGNELKFYSDTTKLISISGNKVEEGIEQLKWDENKRLDKNLTYIQNITNSSIKWKTIDSLTFNKKIYIDTVDNCSKDLLFYRIAIKKNQCVTYSSIISDSLQDKYQPSIPKIVSLGFDTTNQNLILTWKKPRERDLQGIIIYKEINNLSNTLDTVLKLNNLIDTFYRINTPTTNSISNYRIAAFDYCFSTPPRFQTSAQSKSFFTTILNYEYDICTNDMKITWNESITNDEINNYRIHLNSKNKWQIIDSTKNPFYSIKLEKFENYKVTIEAVTKIGHRYFSNNCLIFSKSPTLPKISYTKYTSVNDDHIEINHCISPTTGVKQIALFKLNNQNQFIEIQKVDANKSEIIFNDFDVNTLKKTYSYFIQEIDSCNNYTKIHLLQKTILLEENLKNEDSLSMSLLFDNFKGFFGGTNKCQIFKSIDNINYEIIADFFTDSTNIFNYKIENIDTFEGKICFKTSCLENINIYNSQSTSYSNPLCFYFNSRIFIPNAFTPNGANPTFKPIISISKIESYEINIFNRWGQPVFHSKNINEGWNGKYGNEDSPNGLYIYQFKINEGSDKEIIKRGLINLIR